MELMPLHDWEIDSFQVKRDQNAPRCRLKVQVADVFFCLFDLLPLQTEKKPQFQPWSPFTHSLLVKIKNRCSISNRHLLKTRLIGTRLPVSPPSGLNEARLVINNSDVTSDVNKGATSSSPPLETAAASAASITRFLLPDFNKAAPRW